jgi:hypothetical protein
MSQGLSSIPCPLMSCADISVLQMALIIGSVFYDLQNDTNSLYSKGALLFFAILMSAFQSALIVSAGFLKNFFGPI